MAAFYPIIFAKFLTAEKIAQIIVSPVSGGGKGGGGGGGGDGADGGEGEAKKEAEIEEVEEAPPAVDSEFYSLQSCFGFWTCSSFAHAHAHIISLSFAAHKISVWRRRRRRRRLLERHYFFIIILFLCR